METSTILSNYSIPNGLYDEMYVQGNVRNQYKALVSGLLNLSNEEFSQKNEIAKKLFMTQGITFTVYDNGEGIEKIFPFDVIPRIITAAEWKIIEAGIKQRLKALNIFLTDIYHEQCILKDNFRLY